MVGVAGRSKACVTCKQRKIRCSLEHPECRICIKSSRQCGGYNKERIFILDPRTAKVTQKLSKISIEEKKLYIDTIATQNEIVPKPSSDKIDGAIAISPFDFWQMSPIPSKAAQEIAGTVPTKSAFTFLWNIQCPTTRSLYRQQIIGEFFSSVRTRSGMVALRDPLVPGKFSETWFTLLPTLTTFTTALEAAILAVCTGRLGRANNDEALVRESLRFYIQGLRELQKALWDPNLMYREETVAACSCLVMYEVMECPDKNVKAWMGHMKGCSRLIELRGPRAYDSKFSHLIFLGFRQMEIQHAVAERRSTFLASPAWLELPWKGYTKPIGHNLLDIMAEIAIVADIGYHPIDTENPLVLASTFLDVVNRCWKLDAKLQAFWEELAEHTPGPVYWALLSDGFNSSLDIYPGPHTFPEAYQFPSLETAQTCILYWSSRLIVWSGLIKIYEILGEIRRGFEAHITSLGSATMIPSASASTSASITSLPEAQFLVSASSFSASTPRPTITTTTTSSSSSSFQHTPSSQHPPALNPLTLTTLSSLPTLIDLDLIPLAKNICRSFEYLHKSAMLTATVFPLKCAIEAFGGDSRCGRDLEWAVRLFTVIEKGGIRLLGHLGIELTERSYLS